MGVEGALKEKLREKLLGATGVAREVPGPGGERASDPTPSRGKGSEPPANVERTRL